jgi:hypothetical protein
VPVVTVSVTVLVTGGAVCVSVMVLAGAVVVSVTVVAGAVVVWVSVSVVVFVCVVVNGIDNVVVSVVVTGEVWLDVRHTPPAVHVAVVMACAPASRIIGPAITAESAAHPSKTPLSCLLRGMNFIPARLS